MTIGNMHKETNPLIISAEEHPKIAIIADDDRIKEGEGNWGMKRD